VSVRGIALALLMLAPAAARATDQVIVADVYGYVASVETSYGDDSVLDFTICNDTTMDDGQCISASEESGWPDGLSIDAADTWVVARIKVVLHDDGDIDFYVLRVWTKQEYFGRT
jgi:hypothetical protein